MALPPSQTRSCNAAISLLGDSRRINSITDGTPLAKTLLAVWDEAIEEVLTDHPWNNVIERVPLSVDADFTPQGTQYTQGFAKPANCLRWLPWRQGHPDFFDGEEEGDHILSNDAAPIIFRYIRLEPDISKWTSGMRECLEARLAFKTARAITGSTTVMRDMRSLYEDVLAEARRQDGGATGERARYAQVQSNWLDARNRTSRGIRYR